MLFKLLNLNTNHVLTLGYLNPALNNSALIDSRHFGTGPRGRGAGVGGGGWGNQKGFLREGSALRSNPLPFIHHFDRKCTPSRTPGLEIFILFNYCKYTVFKIP